MWMFRNADQATGYALAQSEIAGQQVSAYVGKLQATIAARRAAATNYALVANVQELRAALAAEFERANFFQSEADKLCVALTDCIEAQGALVAENKALRELASHQQAELESLAAELSRRKEPDYPEEIFGPRKTPPIAQPLSDKEDDFLF
jgi:hypothetical protein